MASAAETLSFEAAVLILLTVGLLILARLVADLRADMRFLNAMKKNSDLQPELKTEIKALLKAELMAELKADLEAGLPSPVDAIPAQGEDVPADVMAAIVSAIHFTVGKRHRIVSVSPAESLIWSREGRRNIFSSHRFR